MPDKDKEKKRERPELGVDVEECPMCHSMVNKNWIPDGICIYCRWSGVKE